MLTLLKKEYIDDEIYAHANALYTYYLTGAKAPAATTEKAKPAGKPVVSKPSVTAAPVTKQEEVKQPEKTFHLDVSDSDSDFNLSDDDDDDGAAALIKKRNEEALAAVLAKEKNKPKARSSIIWDIKPEDDTTDMDAVERAVRAIQLPSLEWQGSDRVPVAYGIMKLRIISQIVDDDVATDDILEAIEQIEGVQSGDIFAFNKV